jgi:hypothetical protein
MPSDVFVHLSQLPVGARVDVGTAVTFVIVPSNRRAGTMMAGNVKVLA